MATLVVSYDRPAAVEDGKNGVSFYRLLHGREATSGRTPHAILRTRPAVHSSAPDSGGYRTGMLAVRQARRDLLLLGTKASFHLGSAATTLHVWGLARLRSGSLAGDPSWAGDFEQRAGAQWGGCVALSLAVGSGAAGRSDTRGNRVETPARGVDPAYGFEALPVWCSEDFTAATYVQGQRRCRCLHYVVGPPRVAP